MFCRPRARPTSLPRSQYGQPSVATAQATVKMKTHAAALHQTSPESATEAFRALSSSWVYVMGLAVRGSNPGIKKCSLLQNVLCQPSLIHNGHRRYFKSSAKLRISGNIPPLPLYAFMTWTTLLFSLFYWFKYSFLLGAFANLRKATISFVMSVCPSAWNNSVPTGRILMRLDIWAFFENLSRKVKFH
jgi:hypothetical protein